MKKTTAIVGLGMTGLSSLEFLYGTDNLVVIDTRELPPELQQAKERFAGVEYRLGISQADFSGIDRVLVSPGVDLQAGLLADARAREIRVISDIELFMDSVTVPVIAITGTNGKSTVTELVGQMLHREGLNPGVGGNLGIPALSLLSPEHHIYVLELSSFQLERLPGETQFHAATVLNISDDHMDRYASFDEYVAAKHKIYLDSRLCVYSREDERTKPRVTSGDAVSIGFGEPLDGAWGIKTIEEKRHIVQGGTPLISCEKLRLQGPHNELNAMAAAALARFTGVTDQSICYALEHFEGLAHRCQTVLQIDGVTFVNDSKATNVGACLAALQRFFASGMQVVLIAGGDGKNADFSPLRDAVARGVKKLVLLGEDAPALQKALGDVVKTHLVRDMAEAVQAANDEAQSGDVVLLAPACASFDMYTSYAQRGEDFERRVRAVRS